MKKLVAVLLSAVLFCLATGIALAEDKEDFPDSGVELAASYCNHNYASSKFVNAETGEIGPFDTSSIDENYMPVFYEMVKMGVENWLGLIDHSNPSRLMIYCPIEGYEYDYSPDNWSIAKPFGTYFGLKTYKDLTFMYIEFSLSTGKFLRGNSEFLIRCSSALFSHFMFGKPLSETGFLSSSDLEAWSVFKNNPDFPKITFDVDIAPPVQSHNLTINYIHTNGQEAASAYSAELEEGENYSIPSPAVEGYAPDRLTVDGTMGTEDVLETVIYNPDAPEVDPPDPGTAGTVTVRYLYADGSTAAPTKTQMLGVGQMFQILSPDVPGYMPSRKIIFGYTGAAELVFDVTYTQQAKASAGGILFAPPDKQDGITWSPGGNSGITWQPNNGGGITFQPQQSGGIFFSVPKSIGAYPFDVPRRWSLWS